MFLMPTPRKPGRPPKRPHDPNADIQPGRSGKRVSVDIDPVVRATLDAFLDRAELKTRLRPSITQVVEKALIELFEREGLWPPAPASRG